jgi:hypothetical protein
MTEQAVTPQPAHRWYAGPVFFVTDVDRAIHFYVDMLSFEKSWHTGDPAPRCIGDEDAVAPDIQSSLRHGRAPLLAHRIPLVPTVCCRGTVRPRLHGFCPCCYMGGMATPRWWISATARSNAR